jgi:hypothetical protein
MYGLLFKIFGIALGILLVFYAAATALRSARRLDRRITEFKEEQEELRKRGIIENPYLALAEIYAEDAATRPDSPNRSRRKA